MASDRDGFEAWLHQGIGNKWISVPECVTHNFDSLLTDADRQRWACHAETCVPVVRLIGLEQVR